jgi:hypothetical protein
MPDLGHITYGDYPGAADLVHKHSMPSSRRTRLAGLVLFVPLAGAALTIWLLVR